MASDSDDVTITNGATVSNKLTIVREEVGDIFGSPRGSVLIHACNTQGVWGAGVALQFKKRYPNAYYAYRNLCLHKDSRLLGTAFLITPDERTPWFEKMDRQLQDDGFYVACLFTSDGYGKHVDPPRIILDNTAKALADLADQVTVIKREQQYNDDPDVDKSQEPTHLGACRAVKINSGKFGVPWESTMAVLENGRLDIIVVAPK